MTEHTAIIRANNEIYDLEQENKQLKQTIKELEHRIRELEHDNEQLFEAKEHWHKIAKSRKTSEHDV